jgi:predicted GTPase
MATEKIVNYTAEQTAQAVADYQAGKTVETIAQAMGKTTRSVIAKLTKEGVYKSKAKEAGKREMLKAEMVTEIATLTGVSEEVLESLEKATGPALMAVLKALREAQ